MHLTSAEKTLYRETSASLKGYDKRQFIARSIKLFDESTVSGKSFARRQFGWSHHIVTKAVHELETEIRCIDAYNQRGRNSAETKLPNLLIDIKEIAEMYSQTDYTFKTKQLYTRLSASSIRTKLIELKNYTDSELPTDRTISSKLNMLGFKLRTVTKNKPKKNT
ncbi:MAG: hypothetical protein KAG61_05430 [Bacteriovoracaceae bacterium]|nr:hypothetical protein [Bacteriovoracaceae bacterium]